MKQTLLTKFFLSFVSIVLMQQVVTYLPKQEVETQTLSVKEIAEQWKKELTTQPEFEQWKDATLSIHPIGPGTHGWIVFIEKEDNTIGYMIIHSDFDRKYILTEYGVGEPAAFQFLTDYYDQWTYTDYFTQIITVNEDNETYYIEPFKLEQFPITSEMLANCTDELKAKKEYSTMNSMPTLITDSYTLDYFSPHDRLLWLTSAPINNKLDDDISIETWIELGSQFYFTVKSWDSTITSVYSITGFHKWDQYHSFMKLDDEQKLISRYIPYDALMSLGNFYTSLED